MSRRMEKVADQLQEEIADLLHREVKHPALADVMVSITQVEPTSDLRTARVHVSVLGPPEQATEVLEALERSEPFIHRTLVRRLHMRRVPRLRFLLDDSIAEGSRMSALMRGLARDEGREWTS